jgi:hypothetical protein
MFVIRNCEYHLASILLRGEMVVLIHTGECAFHASVRRMPGAISSLISITSLSDEGLGLCGLCVSELCVSPVLCFSELCVSPVLVFSFGLGLVPDLFLGEVRAEVHNLPVA